MKDKCKHYEKRSKKAFDEFSRAEYSEDDVKKVLDNEEKIERIMKKGSLFQFYDDVKTFFSMIKDFATRKYRDVPLGTIISIIGTLLFVLAPVDVIPDFLPGIGYLDDATVLGFCMKFVKNDIESYRRWKSAEPAESKIEK